MSVFVRIERFPGPPRFLNIRGLYAIVGEDGQGLLSFADPKHPFFSISSIGKRYMLKAFVPIKLDGQLLSINEQSWLGESSVALIGDYKFFFAITSNLAEALAHSQVTVKELEQIDFSSAKLPTLTVKFENLGRTFPLFPNVEFIIGTDPQVGIHLDLPGIEEQHCRVCYENGKVVFSPMAGRFFVPGKEVGGRVEFDKDCTVKLLPLGIEVVLEMGK